MRRALTGTFRVGKDSVYHVAGAILKEWAVLQMSQGSSSLCRVSTGLLHLKRDMQPVMIKIRRIILEVCILHHSLFDVRYSLFLTLTHTSNRHHDPDPKT
jgi:hypothetical protein